MAEIGLPDAQATSWGAVMAPAGLPAPAVARLNAAIRDALDQQAVKARLAAAGAEGASSSAEDLAAFLRAESAKWARVVREARITVN
jgi:tripartite-type tricarboxylate transporter receptor subunit TctC